jgi:hypothetical protein
MQSNRKMKTDSMRKRYGPGWKPLAVAVMALVASIADATETIVQIEMPVVQAGAGSGSSGTVKTLDWMTDELRALIHAEAAAGSASATGQLGIVDVHKAHSSADSSAWVESWMEFTVEDPQGRPEVKTILDFNVVASAGTPAPGIAALTSSATVIVTIGPSDGSGVQLRVNNDTLSSEIIHTPQFVSNLFQLLASGQTGLFNNADGQPVVPFSLCEGGIWMNGQVVSRHPSAEGCSADKERGRLELTHAPGTYLMQVLVYSNFNGLAVSDPVWQPHPDNPDVIVTRHAPTGLPSAPLAGTNTDDLVAQGIDPTPFIEAGFFDPPSAEPPPPPPPPPSDGGSTPPPPPKYWCSPGFWLNNAVNFGASAWPASERTYYDYNSTVAQLAACPTATGNPTLLEVLQNPKLYFSTQLKGAGFNCVGDYLSGKSALVGTVADNNGVCSIDQFGQHTE